MSEIIYQPTEVSQAPEIAELIAYGRIAAYGLTPEHPAYESLVTWQRSAAGVEKIAEFLADPNAFHAVAVVKGEGIVGTSIASVGQKYDNLEFQFVHEDWQRRGIGQEFLRRFGATATRTQALWTVATNRPAVNLYRGHGHFRAVWASYRVHDELPYVEMKRSKRAAMQASGNLKLRQEAA